MPTCLILLLLPPIIRYTLSSCCPSDQSETESLKQQLSKTRADGESVAGQLHSRVAELEADLKRAVAMGQSDAQEAESRVGGYYAFAPSQGLSRKTNCCATRFHSQF